ncbi:MAG: hypothetical protein Kow0037_11070 [Calditrichia bacterium]
MSKKIVLIDDDVDFVEINKNLLEKEGYTVEVAYDGSEGLEKVKAVKPDLVILDVMMTVADEGFNVAREIKEDENLRNVPILMLSSINKQPNYNWQFGPDDRWNPVDLFLDKPVKPADLLEKVKKLTA